MKRYRNERRSTLLKPRGMTSFGKQQVYTSAVHLRQILMNKRSSPRRRTDRILILMQPSLHLLIADPLHSRKVTSWIYFIGLSLSNFQIYVKLGINIANANHSDHTDVVGLILRRNTWTSTLVLPFSSLSLVLSLNSLSNIHSFICYH